MGGAFEAVEELKGRLVTLDRRAHAPHRVGRADRGRRQPLHRDRPVAARRRGSDPQGRPGGRAPSWSPTSSSWRADRDRRAVDAALDELRRAAESGDNVMPATIALAQAGGTTGEWADVLREVFGEYRAPTGVSGATGVGAAGSARSPSSCKSMAGRAAAVPGGQARPRRPLQRRRADRRRRPRRRAWRSSTRASARRPSRSPPSARDEDLDVIGLSILSGSHLELVPDVLGHLQARASTPRWWSAASSPRTTDPASLRAGRRRGLHAEGLRARPDHGRHRRPRRRPPRRPDPTRPLPPVRSALSTPIPTFGVSNNARHRRLTLTLTPGVGAQTYGLSAESRGRNDRLGGFDDVFVRELVWLQPVSEHGVHPIGISLELRSCPVELVAEDLDHHRCARRSGSRPGRACLPPESAPAA